MSTDPSTIENADLKGQVTLANPRGFCAGVDRAIEIVDRALEKLGAPIYVRHEVVHNRYVVSNLKQKGAIFVSELHEVPDDATVIFSAHGVSEQVEEEAKARQLNVFDATCPLVTKVHLEVLRYSKDAIDTILIGHQGHPEVEGTMGRYDLSFGGAIHCIDSIEAIDQLQLNSADKVAYVTQTTLSVDETKTLVAHLKTRFPNIITPKKEDICYATQNRQDALKTLSQNVDLILVVGSPNSSNSNRLRELAENQGCEAHLIDGAEDIKQAWLRDGIKVGVTAGASAPEILVKQVVEYLRAQGVKSVAEQQGIEETIAFVLPKALRD